MLGTSYNRASTGELAAGTIRDIFRKAAPGVPGDSVLIGD
jgi:hypothetical protein